MNYEKDSTPHNGDVPDPKRRKVTPEPAFGKTNPGDSKNASPGEAFGGGSRLPTRSTWAAANRLERKRLCEKKRRNEFTSSFNSLMTVLLQVDPLFQEEAQLRQEHKRSREELAAATESAESGSPGKSAAKKKKKQNGEDAPIFSRLELVDRAVRSLGALHAKLVEAGLALSFESKGRSLTGKSEFAGATLSTVQQMMLTQGNIALSSPVLIGNSQGKPDHTTGRIGGSIVGNKVSSYSNSEKAQESTHLHLSAQVHGSHVSSPSFAPSIKPRELSPEATLPKAALHSVTKIELGMKAARGSPKKTIVPHVVSPDRRMIPLREDTYPRDTAAFQRNSAIPSREALAHKCAMRDSILTQHTKHRSILHASLRRGFDSSSWHPERLAHEMTPSPEMLFPHVGYPLLPGSFRGAGGGVATHALPRSVAGALQGSLVKHEPAGRLLRQDGWLSTQRPDLLSHATTETLKKLFF